MSKTEDNQKPVAKMVQEFLHPKGGINAIYAFCEILQMPAWSLADELKVSRPRMSHYRNGDLNIPEHRMKSTAQFLVRTISELEKEIAKEKKKSPSKLTVLLIADLERRIELAKKIANI